MNWKPMYISLENPYFQISRASYRSKFWGKFRPKSEFEYDGDSNLGSENPSFPISETLVHIIGRFLFLESFYFEKFYILGKFYVSFLVT